MASESTSHTENPANSSVPSLQLPTPSTDPTTPTSSTQTLPLRPGVSESTTGAPSPTSSATTFNSNPLSTFIPAWRRPTQAPSSGEAAGARRPSVQFVPNIKTPGSRSSSAKAPTVRNKSYNDSIGNFSSTNLNSNLGGTGAGRQRRLSSPPPPAQFRSSVSFDTFRNPAASDFSLTLNRKHRDYVYTKRSRTFLCGTDANEYSDTALDWLIDELVDDGDEVVCLRVVDKDSKEAMGGKFTSGTSGLQREKTYREEAERFLDSIERKNTDDRAISLILEFSIGKVNDTIQQMIRIYEPAMLVVGTRGRSLTGYQGLLSGSVSKYCLQYSPVPVIVVRPSSKREAKKRKRLLDPSRSGYRDILDKSEDAPRGRGGHLLDAQNRALVASSDLGALGELETAGDPDEEARRVAEAIGYHGNGPIASNSALPNLVAPRSSSHARSETSELQSPTLGAASTPTSLNAGRLMRSPDLSNAVGNTNSDDEADDDLLDDDNNASESYQQPLRPEDEAAMLAYERAQIIFEEEKEEAELRAKRQKERSASRGAAGRAGSRGRQQYSDDEAEGGGAAVLGLLAQLDRGMK